MYHAGQMQLQSANLLQGHSADRPCFHAQVARTFSSQAFQVFALPQGLLFLQSKRVGRGGTSDEEQQRAMMVGMMLGGALGAGIGAAIANGCGSAADEHENFELYSEEELFEIAKRRKRSFVSKNDEIVSVAIDAPRGFSRLFAASTLAGYIVVRDSRFGTLTLEIHDQAALSVAVDALPRRFGDRCFVNVELDRNSCKFVSLGR